MVQLQLQVHTTTTTTTTTTIVAYHYNLANARSILAINQSHTHPEAVLVLVHTGCHHLLIGREDQGVQEWAGGRTAVSIGGQACVCLDASLQAGCGRSVVELMLPALLEQLVHHQWVGGVL